MFHVLQFPLGHTQSPGLGPQHKERRVAAGFEVGKGAEITLNREQVAEAFVKGLCAERVGPKRGVRRIDIPVFKAEFEKLVQAEGKAGRDQQEESNRKFLHELLIFSTLRWNWSSNVPSTSCMPY